MSYTSIDNSSLFIGENKFINSTLTVPAFSTLNKGTVLGEVITTGVLAQFKSANSDGSQVPSYILAQNITNSTASAAAFNIRVCEVGEVNSDKLVFNGTDTKDTVVASKGKVSTLLKNNGILVRTLQSISE